MTAENTPAPQVKSKQADSKQASSKPADSKQDRPKSASGKNKNRAANQAALAQISELYPQAFNKDNVRPLKIGIQEDILAEEKISKGKAKRALASYVRSISYLKSIQAGAERVDLKGEAAGTVTEQEAEHAKSKLDEIMSQRKERNKQVRTEERKQRQQQKQEYEARKQKRESRFNDKLSQLINKHQNN